MNWVSRCMVVPSNLQPLAQGLAAGLAGEAGSGMWTTGLSTTAAAPATHYVSTGMIDDTFAALLSDPAAMYAAAQTAGASVTLAQCQSLVSQSDVSDEPPFEAFARLGLHIVNPDTP
jgi:hypothetical protein